MKRFFAIFLACLMTFSIGLIFELEASPTRVTPPAPENVQVEPEDNSAKITWEPPSGLTGSDLSGYNVYKGSSADDVDTIIANLGPFVVVYEDTPLVNGNTYYYSVVAINLDGSGDKSTPISCIPRGPASPPTNIQKEHGANRASFTWEEPVEPNGSPITGYVVFKGLNNENITIRNDVNNNLDFLDMGLTNGKRYYYQIAAITDYGDGDKTSILSVVPRTYPSPPTNFSATGNDGSTTLSWNYSLDNGGAFVEGYSVFRGLTIEGIEKIRTVTDEMTFTDTEVVNGVTYLYSIAAFNSEGNGDLASAISVTPLGPPDRPQNMLLNAGDTQVHLTWEEPANDGGSEILGYRIYKNKHNEEMTMDSEVGDVLEHTVTDLENNQIYYFQVRALNIVGEGKGSNTTLIRPEPLPKTPESFRVFDLEDQVKLQWVKPSYTGEYTYEHVLVYRGDSEETMVLYKTLSTDISQYFDEDVDVGTVYYYEISIVSSIGEGYRTPIVIGRPYDRPSIPTSFDIRTESGKAFLTWDQPDLSGGRVIESFNIYRGTDIETLTVLANVPGRKTYYNDTTLTNGISYYYKISAVNMELEGNTTEVVEIVSVGPPNKPSAGKAYFDSVNKTVEISWTDPISDGGSGVTKFFIYRGDDRDNLSFIKEILAGEPFHDEDIENGVGYYYAISAINDEGEGPQSPVFYVEIPSKVESDTADGPGAILWIVIVAIVVIIMVAIIVIALMASKKKDKEEVDEDAPILEESESEREERLIMERRQQMGEFTSISTNTTEAHAGDSHGSGGTTYDDLYGSSSIYDHHEEEKPANPPVVEQQVVQGAVPEQQPVVPQYQPPQEQPQQQPVIPQYQPPQGLPQQQPTDTPPS